MELITDSVNKIEDGTRLVDEAGSTMKEIVTSVQRVTDIMSEISAASQEQGSGIEQVNQVVTQMDEVTQQNAALVEAAAESMQDQSQALLQSVAVFKLAGGMTSAPVRLSNHKAPVAKIPSQLKSNKAVSSIASRKAVKGKTDDIWEEF